METRRVKQLLILWLAACGLLAAAPPVRGQSAEHVAVVINTADPGSVRVGEHYVQRRGIPAANVVRITTSSEEAIDRAEFDRTIQSPIAAALAREQLQDRVLYLVLTKGIPLRVVGTGGQEGTGASVDSELTLLYRRMVGTTVLTRGHVDNPYYLGTREVSAAKPFTHREHDIYLVSRLDAFTVEEAMALVDRAMAPAAEGRVVLVPRDEVATSPGDRWLLAAAERLTASGHGDRVLHEATATPARDVSPVLGYYSWGSTDPRHRERRAGMGFVPGALAATFVSTDARTFREPPPDWVPTGAPTRTSQFAGTAHSLTGDLIREGVTGAAGHVAEPYLQSVVRPDVLFSAYLAGHNLIESFYLALPHLSWQAVVVGDPLCAPFARPAVDRAALDPALDPATGLPAFFSARRIRQVAGANRGMSEPAAAAWIRAMELRARGDAGAARQALEQSIELAPDVVGPRQDLSMLYEQGEEFEKAIEQYRRILTIQPNHVIALNNLAYGMAVRQGEPAEALPLARRAYALAPTSASVLDTLAWIEHLLGNNAAAVALLKEAIERSPAHADIRLHAAIVHAALADRESAEAELKEALRLNPALGETEQVQELKRQLKIEE